MRQEREPRLKEDVVARLSQSADYILKSTREWLQALKRFPCYDCGDRFHPICMDFHHLDPTQKKFNISQSIGKLQPVVLEEVAKCVLLCANCHRLRSLDGGSDSLY